MRAMDIIEALEAGLITEGEAAEQAMVDSVDALYEKASGKAGWGRGGARLGSSRSHRG